MNEALGKRILVTGDTDFLGRHIDRAFRKFGPEAVWSLERDELDGLSKKGLVELMRESRAQVVIHLCDLDIGSDCPRPQDSQPAAQADFGQALFEAIAEAGLAACAVVGSSLAYPPVAAIPWRENEFANEPPAGLQSRAVQAQRGVLLRGVDEAARHGLPVVTLLLGEVYGPEICRSGIDAKGVYGKGVSGKGVYGEGVCTGDGWHRPTGSLVDSLLRELLEAREADRGQLSLSLSGMQSRDFLFVRDAAEAIALAVAKPAGPAPGPVNIGTGVETTLGSLVEMAAAGLDYTGEIIWGRKIIGGVSRQRLDCSRAANIFGFSADTCLDAGLRETIAWHDRQRSGQTGVAR